MAKTAAEKQNVGKRKHNNEQSGVVKKNTEVRGIKKNKTTVSMDFWYLMLNSYNILTHFIFYIRLDQVIANDK